VTSLLRFIFNALVVTSLVGCWAFVILYTRTWPWWRNEMGRYIVAFSGSLGLFMFYYTLRIFIGEIPAQVWIVLSLFIVLTVVIWWQLILFIRIRREQRRQKALEAVDSGEDAGS
jgi:hypothetical protein